MSTKVAKRKNLIPAPAWGVLDAVIVLGLSVALPIVILLVIVGLGRIGFYPRAVGKFLVADGLLPGAVRYLLTLLIELSLLILVLRRYGKKWQDFGIKKFNWFKGILSIIGVYIGFSLGIVVIFVLVTVLFPSINTKQAQDTAFEFGHSNVALIVSFIASVVIAPIVEEIQFRGFILPAFEKSFGQFFGLILTSLTFAALHLQVNVVIYTFVLAIILGLMYRRLGSIVPGIIVHTINNLLAFLAVVGILR